MTLFIDIYAILVFFSNTAGILVFVSDSINRNVDTMLKKFLNEKINQTLTLSKLYFS